MLSPAPRSSQPPFWARVLRRPGASLPPSSPGLLCSRAIVRQGPGAGAGALGGLDHRGQKGSSPHLWASPALTSPGFLRRTARASGLLFRQTGTPFCPIYNYFLSSVTWISCTLRSILLVHKVLQLEVQRGRNVIYVSGGGKYREKRFIPVDCHM